MNHVLGTVVISGAIYCIVMAAYEHTTGQTVWFPQWLLGLVLSAVVGAMFGVFL